MTKNTWKNNFLNPTRDEKIMTSSWGNLQEFNSPNLSGIYFQAEMSNIRGAKLNLVTWYRKTLTQFASQFSGFALSIVSVTRFLLSYLQEHEQTNAMLNSLYGDVSEVGERPPRKDSSVYGHYWATKTFEKRVKGRKELNSNYFAKSLFWSLENLCCCLKSCWSRVGWIRNGTNKQRKIQIAMDRLCKEQDIQHLIEMNRTTRIIHKATFLRR